MFSFELSHSTVGTKIVKNVLLLEEGKEKSDKKEENLSTKTLDGS